MCEARGFMQSRFQTGLHGGGGGLSMGGLAVSVYDRAGRCFFSRCFDVFFGSQMSIVNGLFGVVLLAFNA